MVAGTNLYKRKTKISRKVNRAAEREGASILIGNLPLFQPGVPLEFVSSAGDYEESEARTIPRNKANNYFCRSILIVDLFSAEDFGESEIGTISKNRENICSNYLNSFCFFNIYFFLIVRAFQI